MMGHDFIRPDPNRHGALRIMENALPILRDEESVTLRMDTVKFAKSSPRIKMLVCDEDEEVPSKNSILRKRIGKQPAIRFADDLQVEANDPFQSIKRLPQY